MWKKLVENLRQPFTNEMVLIHHRNTTYAGYCWSGTELDVIYIQEYLRGGYTYWLASHATANGIYSIQTNFYSSGSESELDFGVFVGVGSLLFFFSSFFLSVQVDGRLG